MRAPSIVVKPFDKPFRAIAFDFDGTLVDTLHLHFLAYRNVFEGMGLSLTPEDFYPNLGGKAVRTIPLFLRGRSAPLSLDEIHVRKKEEISVLFRDAPLRLLPTAALLPLFAGRVPLALVSSGSRPGILQLLERLGWTETFATVICGEDTPESKPDPMPYLLAAEKLAVPAEEIAAFEDSPAGLESARSAGMSVFDVSRNELSPPE